MIVQHNLQAMNASRMLNITTGNQSKATEKLSSGYRINRAADDAAGLTISEKMRKQIRGLTQASTNAQDGISCVQTAEGALTEVHSMLQRMNELSVQAANGTMSTDDRQAVQDEIDQLITEIDRVSETTKFNEIYLLKGDPATQTEETKTTYTYELTDLAKAAESGELSILASAPGSAYGAGETAAVTASAAAAAASMALDTTALGGTLLFVSPTGAGQAGTDHVEVTAANLSTYFDVDNAGTVTAKAGLTFVTAGNATLANAGGGTVVADPTSGATAYVTGTAASSASDGTLSEYVYIDENGAVKYKEGKMLYTVAADDTNEYGAQLDATEIAEADLSNYFGTSANPLVDSNGNKITDFTAYFKDGAYQGGIYRNSTGATPARTEIGAEQIADYINVKSKSTTYKTAETLEFNLHVGSEALPNNKIGVSIEAISASGIGVVALKERRSDDRRFCNKRSRCN